MQANNSAVVSVLPSTHDDKRIEVVIEQQNGADCVALRYSTWTDGLGWCGQKTIRLDGEQLDDLHRALTVARQRINRQRAETGVPALPAQVIKFPTLA